jgi:hypothetical protein
VSRLIIAIVMGAAIGAAALVQNALSSVANGTASNSSLYQYGSR